MPTLSSCERRYKDRLCAIAAFFRTCCISNTPTPRISKAAGRRAGVGNVSPKILRHSAAVRMAEDGVPMEEIAQYLGHRNVNVTRRIYARFSPDHNVGAHSQREPRQGGAESP